MRPNLPEVTLVAATSIALDATAKALSASLDQADFGMALLLSDRPPSVPMDPRIQWKRIAPLTSRAAYSRFMLHHLTDHISTSHVLCIQWDGYVLNGTAWDPRFLAYDYVGAVWPQFSDGMNVGNGGFSLRSKRLLDAVRDLPYDGSTAEDLFICRDHRAQLEEAGLRFAPKEVAERFAFERTPSNGSEFGFHGAFNLVNRINRPELTRLLKSLEPQVLNRNEHKELLRWALRKGYLAIVSLLVCRILRQRPTRQS